MSVREPYYCCGKCGFESFDESAFVFEFFGVPNNEVMASSINLIEHLSPLCKGCFAEWLENYKEEQYEEKIAEYEDNKPYEISCPNCDHTWKPIGIAGSFTDGVECPDCHEIICIGCGEIKNTGCWCRDCGSAVPCGDGNSLCCICSDLRKL